MQVAMQMAKYNKYMPMWIGDYLRDTTHLTAQRHGVYTLLIYHYWANECIPEDMDEIYILTKAFNESVKADVTYILSHYFKDFKHDRIEKSLEESRAKYQKRVDAQAASVVKRKENASCNANDNVNSIVVACASDSDSDSIITLSKKEIAFNEFWDMVTWKTDKGSAKTAWNKIKAKDYQLVMDAFANALKSDAWTKDGGKYIQKPHKWLNAEGWLNKSRKSDEPAGAAPWEQLKAMIGNCQPDQYPKFDDPLISKALFKVGTWMAFSRLTPQQQHFTYEANFKEAYNELKRGL